MTSLIKDFQYDIFISYRQKDNKYDGWVSEFVDNLKRELEATFKEEIGVYFDVNLHDGLLETHNVDASLKEKLRCLVFIPILSQTYCDPKSFAWKNEFMAFNRMASEDLFGRDITLPNGNVASRILPVKIHELDPSDQKIFEEETGGVLRAIEFIYREPGVNRPLRPDDDPKENLNKTKYRNQVNKVANAIKDIISGIKNFNASPGEAVFEASVAKTTRPKKLNRKFIYSAIAALLLVIAGYFIIPSLSGSAKEVEKSIAVLPFANFSNDPEQDYFSDAMVDEILDRLCKVGDLQVSSRTSSMTYKNTNLPLKEIGDQLEVSNILEGSVRKIDQKVRIIVQLVDAKSDKHLWSETYDRNYTDIFSLTSEIAETIAGKLDAIITAREKHLMEKIPTSNMDAYNDFIIGRHYWRNFTPEDFKMALQYFESAKTKDKNFALAYLGISDVWYGYLQLGFPTPGEPDPMGKCLSSLETAYKLDSTLAEVHYSMGNIVGSFEWDWPACEEEYRKALAINPNYADAYAAQSNLYAALGRKEESFTTIETALRLDPQNIFNQILYGATLGFARRYDDALNTFNDVMKEEPNNFIALNWIPCIYNMTGKYNEAIKAWRKFASTFYNDGNIDYDQMLNYDLSRDSYASVLNALGDTLAAHVKTTQFDKFNLALIYACAENNAKVLDMLDQAYEEHNLNLPFLQNPCFDVVREEPRFKDLCRKLNLPA